MFLIQKYTQYKAAQAEQNKKKVTEKELAQLNHKIDKLLTKLDEHEPEIAANQDEECVVCVNAKATMTTYPCAHRVICRKCFVKTIQMAVAQRLLPLRCVICRAKILRLKHTNNSATSMTLPNPSSAGSTNGSGSSNCSNSSYNWYHVPQSASLYSVTSNNSGVSGVSSASSNSSKSSYKTCASSFSAFRKSHSAYAKMGYEPLRNSSSSPPPLPAITTSTSTSKNTHSHNSSKSNKFRSSPSLELNRSLSSTPFPPPKGKFKLVQEFQREFRMGRNSLPVGGNKKPQQQQSQLTSSHSFTIHSTSASSSNSATSASGGTGSSRIKCAKQLINQAHCPTVTSTTSPEADDGTGVSTTCANSGSNKIPKSVSFSHHHGHGQQRQLKSLRSTHSSDSVSTLKNTRSTIGSPSPDKAKPKTPINSKSNPNSSKFLSSVTQKYHKTSPTSKNSSTSIIAMRFFKSSSSS